MVITSDKFTTNGFYSSTTRDFEDNSSDALRYPSGNPGYLKSGRENTPSKVFLPDYIHIYSSECPPPWLISRDSIQSGQSLGKEVPIHSEENNGVDKQQKK